MATAGFAPISGLLFVDRSAYPRAFRNFNPIPVPLQSTPAASKTKRASEATNPVRARVFGPSDLGTSPSAGDVGAASIKEPSEAATDPPDSNR